MILEIANSAKFRDLSPCKIVPLLADEGRYIASESTFYRVLKDEKQLTHRHKSAPQKHHKPEAFTPICQTSCRVYTIKNRAEMSHHETTITRWKDSHYYAGN